MKNYISQLRYILFGIIMATMFACGSLPDIKNDSEVREFLSENKLYMEGDCTFSSEGTFQIVPASPNDPTHIYKGVYTLGEYDEGISREIKLIFNNYGYITDGHTFNGTNFQGVGRQLNGKISIWKYQMGVKGDLTLKENHPAGWIVGEGGETEINTKTTNRYELEPK